MLAGAELFFYSDGKLGGGTKFSIRKSLENQTSPRLPGFLFYFLNVKREGRNMEIVVREFRDYIVALTCI